jgi:predicted nucleic acid-binding protein
VSYLIDTIIISEVRKGVRCHPSVARWWAGVDDDQLFLSVLVVGEIRRGVETSRRRAPEKAAALEQWLDDLRSAFAERVLPVTDDVAETWGRMNAIRTVPVVDGLLAATAKVHGLALVTRNMADVAGLGAELINPFEWV